MEYRVGGFAVSNAPGRLYVVATPIGNLDDITRRAATVLGAVDAIAAEDTRRTGQLLAHLGLRRPLVSLHEHNEEARATSLLARLRGGETLALVSDAGTPLVSDPGYRLVRACRAAGVPVLAVPGPSSITAALSVAGLPTDRFLYEGFLPARPAARRRRLAELAGVPCTLVLLESSHRVAASLADLAAVFGGEREAALARELTKAFETVRLDRLDALAAWVAADPDQQRGEHVILVGGAPPGPAVSEGPSAAAILAALRAEGVGAKQAARIAARLTGEPQNALYRQIIGTEI